MAEVFHPPELALERVRYTNQFDPAQDRALQFSGQVRAREGAFYTAVRVRVAIRDSWGRLVWEDEVEALPSPGGTFRFLLNCFPGPEVAPGEYGPEVQVRGVRPDGSVHQGPPVEVCSGILVGPAGPGSEDPGPDQDPRRKGKDGDPLVDCRKNPTRPGCVFTVTWGWPEDRRTGSGPPAPPNHVTGGTTPGRGDPPEVDGPRLGTGAQTRPGHRPAGTGPGGSCSLTS